MTVAFVTLLHNVTTVWACIVAGLGSQLAAVDPAVLVQGDLTSTQEHALNAYWNVSRTHMTDQSHRKDALWSLTQYERVLYIDGDMLLLPSFDRRKSLAVFGSPPGFYAVNFSKPGICFNAGIMLLEPDRRVYERLRSVTTGSRCGGVDQKVLTAVLTRHDDIHLSVCMASHFSGASIKKYDVYNTYNSQRSVRDVLFGIKPKLREGARLHGIQKYPKLLDYVDGLFQARNDALLGELPECRLS